ncbi:MAG TPA: Gfo/Idh/MocA family oxidoreductase [Streptosporangiaceae bacterium]
MSPGPASLPLSIGVLGCADIAWRNTVPAFIRAGARLAAFASRDAAKSKRFAERFGGVPVKGYERLLDRTDIDVVYIPLPTSLHYFWALCALDAGKHVLVEKPLATNLAEAKDLVAMACKRRRWLMENFGFLYHSQHAHVQQLIADGVIGEPQVFSGVFGIPARHPSDIRYRAELGGGALLDLGVYTLRAADFLLCQNLKVIGSALRLDVETGVDLGGNALLGSTAGISVELAFGFQLSYQSTYSIWGSEGRITLGRAFTPPAELRPPLRLQRRDRVEEITLAADDQFVNLMRVFADSAVSYDGFESCAQTLLRQAALVDQIRVSASQVPVRRIDPR